jgi:hypothetical protein
MIDRIRFVSSTDGSIRATASRPTHWSCRAAQSASSVRKATRRAPKPPQTSLALWGSLPSDSSWPSIRTPSARFPGCLIACRRQLGALPTDTGFAVLDLTRTVFPNCDIPLVKCLPRQRPTTRFSAIGRSEALSRTRAIESYVHGGTYAMSQDDWRTVLEAGRAADLIVVDGIPSIAPWI